jgi:hypothetical protein
MVAPSINREPSNHAIFTHVREAIRGGCAPDAFAKELLLLNPTPAQIFQLLEITVLSESSLESKNELMQKLGEHAVATISTSTIPQRDRSLAHEMIHAYKEAADTTAWCQDLLSGIRGNVEAREGLSAAEFNLCCLAELQDMLRFILRTNRLPVEDRTEYKDPVLKVCRRSREDFLDGKGVYNPAELES